MVFTKVKAVLRRDLALAEAIEVVDGEGQECDVVCVDGLDDGRVGDGAVGASC